MIRLAKEFGSKERTPSAFAINQANRQITHTIPRVGSGGAVAGTFTAIGVAVVIMLLVAFPCSQRYRRNRLCQAPPQGIHIPQPQTREDHSPIIRFRVIILAICLSFEHGREWKRRPVCSTADKNALEHLEGGFTKISTVINHSLAIA